MRARDALICVFVAVILLLLIEGASIRNSGKKMDSGIQRSIVLAVGHPAGWLADQLPLAAAADKLTAALSPDDDLSAAARAASTPRRSAAVRCRSRARAPRRRRSRRTPSIPPSSASSPSSCPR